MLDGVAPPSRLHREALVDWLIAAAFAVVSALLIVGTVHGAGERAVATAVALVHVVPLGVRRRWPLGVLATMAVTSLLTVPLGLPVIILGPAALVASYTVGSQSDPARGRPALVGALAVMSGVVLANGMNAGTVLTNAIALTVAWWLGDRTRRAGIETEQHRMAAVEAARRAAAGERLRIARELHDVVAHAMSVIAVQAGTGRFVIDESPEVARDALASIESTSRTALQEMRRLLLVLRDEDMADGDLLPAPGLGDLQGLVAATSDAGVHVDVQVRGDVAPLPSGLDLCAYRVIQEALTNVRKHARASLATVTVAYEPGALTVEVTDDGVGQGRNTGGHGHIGMRERVSLYDGVLEVGPCPTGGYRVRARLPLAVGR
jgi:signal transduction histidine kinase